ncbi:hypothetical protein F7Q99_21605 [Streptomyces kaniharaensis]|uniref:Uncharacterized protein n=1 Tax=Streptomyces kaniharaensis TaxID=212423 RepID=A0A6N7KT64_9ACTN|nr:hypothetical protein [Streptomyces kaniharaensis]MQS14786.1 hypothetical protein [Streptomyces kaniharaensis]
MTSSPSGDSLAARPPAELHLPARQVHFISGVVRMPDYQLTSVPRDFLCEHTPSKSRVLALVAHDGGPASLQAVLTCREPEVAHRAAQLLLSALRSRPGPWVAERVDDLCGQLPDAPAASLRQAVERALAGIWTASAGTLINWPEGRADAGSDDGDDLKGDNLDGDGESDQDGEESDRATRTPHDARLRDLAGPVVRVAMLREFHVHDRKALLDAAAEQGWTALPAEDLTDDDPHDLVGAVMWLADPAIEIEGADSLLDRTQGFCLRRDKGHEVAQWSAEPIVEDFGAGWRQPETDRSEESTRDEELPDFAEIFRVESAHCDDPECGEEPCQWQLTPRTADILHTTLCLLADEAYDDADELGDGRLVPDEHEGNWGVFARLPKLTFDADLQWRRRFARAADDLADDLEHGRWPQPTCTAEELALHLALDDARDRATELDEEDDSDTHSMLPTHPDDYDYGTCTEMFFQDTDVLMLYSPRFDGIEDPDADTNQQLGGGDLRAKAWFEPFLNVKTRDPHRGFRR